ncbi:hypothetical protein KC678_05520, partial [Candidatus Dojkabacteria bacterium]|nr:hypothetical protein [Candidatus Dojkabacteria bacterium]
AANAAKAGVNSGKAAETFFGFKNLGNFTSGAIDAFANKKGMNYLKSFADNEIVRNSAGNLTKNMAQGVGRVGDKAGIIQRSVGKMARELEFLGKGISTKTQGFTGNASQFGKNIVDDTKRQVTDALHTVKDSSKFNVINGKDGKQFIQGKGIKIPFTSKRLKGPKRLIKGKVTDPNNADFKGVIVKKRAPIALGAVAATPVGMAGISALTGDPEDGIKEYASWKTPLGPTKMMYDIINPGK